MRSKSSQNCSLKLGDAFGYPVSHRTSFRNEFTKPLKNPPKRTHSTKISPPQKLVCRQFCGRYPEIGSILETRNHMLIRLLKGLRCKIRHHYCLASSRGVAHGTTMQKSLMRTYLGSSHTTAFGFQSTFLHQSQRPRTESYLLQHIPRDMKAAPPHHIDTLKAQTIHATISIFSKSYVSQ